MASLETDVASCCLHIDTREDPGHPHIVWTLDTWHSSVLVLEIEKKLITLDSLFLTNGRLETVGNPES
jgi:hypothetical protein